MNDMHETINGAAKHAKVAKRAASKSAESAEVIADDFTGKIRAAADDAEERIKRYSEAALDFAKENPMYIALGILAVGAVAGAFLFSRQDKRSQ